LPDLVDIRRIASEPDTVWTGTLADAAAVAALTSK
jgi:hypothetical protein